MSEVLVFDEQDEQLLSLAVDATSGALERLRVQIHCVYRGDNVYLEHLRLARIKLYAAARYLDAIIEE